jgi:hypothetical protein
MPADYPIKIDVNIPPLIIRSSGRLFPDEDIVLGEIGDQDEKGNKSQNQAEETGKPAVFYQSATGQNHKSRLEAKSSQVPQF